MIPKQPMLIPYGMLYRVLMNQFFILGGQDKGNDYSLIEPLVVEKVKKIYAIGSSAEKIFNFFHKKVKVEIKKNLEEVINLQLMKHAIMMLYCYHRPVPVLICLIIMNIAVMFSNN
jgi:hypothetical protein